MLWPLLVLLVVVGLVTWQQLWVYRTGYKGSNPLKKFLMNYASTHGWTAVIPIPKDTGYTLGGLVWEDLNVGYAPQLLLKSNNVEQHELLYVSKIAPGSDEGVSSVHFIFFTTSVAGVIDGRFCLVPYSFIHKRIPSVNPAKNPDAGITFKGDAWQQFITSDFHQWYDNLDRRPIIVYEGNRLSVGYGRNISGFVPAPERIDELYEQFKRVVQLFEGKK